MDDMQSARFHEMVVLISGRLHLDDPYVQALTLYPSTADSLPSRTKQFFLLIKLISCKFLGDLQQQSVGLFWRRVNHWNDTRLQDYTSIRIYPHAGVNAPKTHRFKPYRRNHFRRRSGMHLKRMCHKCKCIRLPKMHNNRNSSQSMRSRDIAVPQSGTRVDSRSQRAQRTRVVGVQVKLNAHQRYGQILLFRTGFRIVTEIKRFCSGHNQGCCCFKQSRPPSSVVPCLPNMASSPQL